MVSLAVHTRSPKKLFRRKERSNSKFNKLHFQSSTLSDTSLSFVESSSTTSIAKDPPPDKEAKSDLVVVLDLDECLIYNSNRSKKFEGSDAIAASSSESVESFSVSVEGRLLQVKKRPHLEEFLQHVCSRYAEVHIFTASMQVYADPIIDQLLDPSGFVFKQRWYRQDCRYDDNINQYIKDLTVLDKPMERVVLIDNNPDSFMANPDNGILVPDFYGNPEDTDLLDVMTLLDEIDQLPDVRPLLQERFRLREKLEEYAESCLSNSDTSEAPEREGGSATPR